MKDNIPDEIKSKRLEEVIDLQRKISLEVNVKMIGKTKEILLETISKKSDENIMGRTDCNKSTIISRFSPDNKKEYKIGEFVNVNIKKANSATLFGEVIN